MKAFRPLAAVLLIPALAAAPAPPGRAVLFRDDFNGRLADGWVWVREDKAAWELGDGFLRVRPLPGNLWEGQNDARNLLLRNVPEGAKEFVAEVTVSHAPAAFGEQSGLLWYRDDDHYVKLTKEFYDDKTWVVLAAERGGKAQYAEAECKGDPMTLRLTVKGDEVSGAFRPKGESDWRPVGKSALKFPQSEGTRIGLTAHHGPKGVERWATFTAFRVDP